jgi:hypothetical protein
LVGARTPRRLRIAAKILLRRSGDGVMYAEGAVRLSVLSHAGNEAVVAVLDAGHFFGEGCLAGQSQRMATATAMAPCTIVAVEKLEMVRHLRARPAFADGFLAHMLTRNIRIEEDLIDQLFNSSESGSHRLLLARYGEPGISPRPSGVSQALLAEMVGTTRCVNFFMNKFQARLSTTTATRRSLLSPDRRNARLTSCLFGIPRAAQPCAAVQKSHEQRTHSARTATSAAGARHEGRRQLWPPGGSALADEPTPGGEAARRGRQSGDWRRLQEARDRK